jgi:hypothetical protein
MCVFCHITFSREMVSGNLLNSKNLNFRHLVGPVVVNAKCKQKTTYVDVSCTV